MHLSDCHRDLETVLHGLKHTYEGRNILADLENKVVVRIVVKNDSPDPRDNV